jgi:DUF1680 family protein
MSTAHPPLNRRTLLQAMIAGAVASPVGAASAAAALDARAAPVEPVGLAQVRLLPSPYRDALDANLAYLLFLSSDRFLHNYHQFAGLPVKGEVYGGWESDTIAGEGLGHYLSALALMHAQTGNVECRARIAYIVAEMARVQAAQGDGYCAGFLRKDKDGRKVDGKVIFTEIAAGDIRSTGFDLNGAWSPLYNVHKVFAGLLDAHELAGNEQALQVALAFGAYLDKVFADLSEAQMQSVLACEYGGLNESFFELYARTGDARWLRLARRLRDHKVMDAVVARRDELGNLHANTQIPKVIGLARQSEVSSAPDEREGARFFWDRVTRHHSFVIGGNGDREYFFAPDTLAQHVTEQTCEHCASYNMLKLTRHVHAWQPHASQFDYYERTHLNHVLAAQDPRTGMFTYMTPLMSGSTREFSSKENDFWCCVLSGMESHAKHGDSIWWQPAGARAADTLFVNLFIPSTLDWTPQQASFRLDTRYPYDGRIALTVTRAQPRRAFEIALRIPGWAETATLHVNGQPATATRRDGYAVVRRRWKTGDVLTLDLPLALRLEATPGDDRLVAVLRGPLVLAADLGAAADPYEADAPALVGSDLIAALKPVTPEQAIYRSEGIGRPGDMTFKPFYSQYDRRSAVYFNAYTEAQWTTAQVAYRAEQARLKDLAARSVDVMHLGEMQPEHDHDLRAEISYPESYRGRLGRDARTGGFMQFEMKTTRDGKPSGPLLLQATYWGSDTNRVFDIVVDGVSIATERLVGRKPGAWLDVDYPIPPALTAGKEHITVRFQPGEGKTAGPVFGVRLFTALPAGGEAGR